MSEVDFARLLRARHLRGTPYGSEHLCMLLYALARRERPRRVVELGTGLGATTVWLAAALLENGDGRLWSFDDNSHLDQIGRAQLDGFADELELERGLDMLGFAVSLLDRCGVAAPASFVEQRIDLGEAAAGRVDWAFGVEPIDWVFSDIRHGPEAIEQLLAAFLPLASPTLGLFIDSASTKTTSFLVAERLVDQLNRNKLPAAWTVFDEEWRERLTRVVAQREFALTHLVERRNQPQNSTMWITAQPVGWRPYPATMMRN